MIDYEKIKLLHELAMLLEHPYYLSITTNKCETEYSICDADEKIINSILITTTNIDTIITKLTELTSLEPKYKIGQKLWRLNYTGEILSGIVQEVVHYENSRSFYYFLDKYYLNGEESYFFPSESALIEAQVVYWLDKKEHPKIKQEIADEYCEISGVKLDKNSAREND